MHPDVVTDHVRAVQAERLAVAGSRRRPPDRGDLERLVAKAAAGDEPAWSALVTRFGPHLLRIARTHGLSRHEAEDAIQDTWMRLLRNIDRVREPRAIGGWLTTTTHHESLRVRRLARREHPTAEELQTDIAVAAEAEQELHAAECRAVVTLALEALPARHRTLIRALFADAEPSYKEIAARLDVPIGSIGPTRARCLARLRRDARLRRFEEPLG